MDENINSEKKEGNTTTPSTSETQVTSAVSTPTTAPAVKVDPGVVKGNIVGILVYLGTIIASILILLLEKDNKFVRFHAIQSLVTTIAIFIIVMVTSAIASVFWVLFMLIPLIWLLAFALLIFLMYKTYQGEMYRLPAIGDFAAKHAGV